MGEAGRADSLPARGGGGRPPRPPAPLSQPFSLWYNTHLDGPEPCHAAPDVREGPEEVHGDNVSREAQPHQPTFLTREGRDQLEAELRHLRSERRREVALRIKRAAELGDRSENSEYEDAKNEQAFIEGRIQELDLLLRDVQVIDAPGKGRSDMVAMGSTVRVTDTATGEDTVYTLVGPVEVDPAQGRISHLSPVGAALLGRSVGETVRVVVPAGTLKLRVTHIQ